MVAQETMHKIFEPCPPPFCAMIYKYSFPVIIAQMNNCQNDVSSEESKRGLMSLPLENFVRTLDL